MMANIRFRSIEGYESFKTKCNFFRCEEEYPGWTGNEKYTNDRFGSKWEDKNKDDVIAK